MAIGNYDISGRSLYKYTDRFATAYEGAKEGVAEANEERRALEKEKQDKKAFEQRTALQDQAIEANNLKLLEGELNLSNEIANVNEYLRLKEGATGKKMYGTVEVDRSNGYKDEISKIIELTNNGDLPGTEKIKTRLKTMSTADASWNDRKAAVINSIKEKAPDSKRDADSYKSAIAISTYNEDTPPPIEWKGDIPYYKLKYDNPETPEVEAEDVMVRADQDAMLGEYVGQVTGAGVLEEISTNAKELKGFNEARTSSDKKITQGDYLNFSNWVEKRFSDQGELDSFIRSAKSKGQQIEFDGEAGTSIEDVRQVLIGQLIASSDDEDFVRDIQEFNKGQLGQGRKLTYSELKDLRDKNNKSALFNYALENDDYGVLSQLGGINQVRWIGEDEDGNEHNRPFLIPKSGKPVPLNGTQLPDGRIQLDDQSQLVVRNSLGIPLPEGTPGTGLEEGADGGTTTLDNLLALADKKTGVKATGAVVGGGNPPKNTETTEKTPNVDDNGVSDFNITPIRRGDKGYSDYSDSQKYLRKINLAVKNGSKPNKYDVQQYNFFAGKVDKLQNKDKYDLPKDKRKVSSLENKLKGAVSNVNKFEKLANSSKGNYYHKSQLDLYTKKVNEIQSEIQELNDKIASVENPKVVLNEALASDFEGAKSDLGLELVITSDVRSEDENKAAGGVSNSRHLSGNAIDIRIKNLSKSDTLKVQKYFEDKGYKVLNEGDHLHVADKSSVA